MFRKTLLTICALFLLTAHADAAYFYIVPDKTSLTAGELSGATVYINSEGQAVNNGEAVITFKPSLLNVESVLSSDSILSIWIESPTFSNSSGQVSFNGGVPNPGFKGTSGKVARIIFKAKSAISPSFTFTTESIRANDGLGTEVARHAPGSDAPAPVAEAPVTPAPTPTVTPTPTSTGRVPGLIALNSRDIPTEDTWYNGTKALFTWSLPGDVNAVQTLLGSHSDSVPLVVYAPPVRSKTLENLVNGVWYLHIRARNDSGWGPITHRKIKIDQTAPEGVSGEFKEEGESFILLASAKDSLSGIKSFEVKGSALSDKLTADAVKGDTTTITLPSLPSGEQKLTLVAYDNAGNSTEKELTVTVPERILDTPTLSPLPETSTEGEAVAVSGKTTYAGVEITVFAETENGEKMEFKASSDESGSFILNIPDTFEGKMLKLRAAVTEGDVLKSSLSPWTTTRLQGNIFSKLTTLLQKIDLVKVLILLAIILILVILFLLRKIYVLKVHIKDHIHGGAIDIKQVFDIIRKDKANTSAIIEKTKRSLSEEDIKKIKVIDDDLSAAEKYFDSRVKKLEVESKAK